MSKSYAAWNETVQPRYQQQLPTVLDDFGGYM